MSGKIEIGAAKNSEGSVKKANAKTADALNYMYQLRSLASVANFNLLERNDSATTVASGANNNPSVDYIEVGRQRLKKIMAQSWFGRYYENALLSLSVISCLEYIYQTYLHPSIENDQEQLHHLAVLEIVFASIFAFDWCLNCFLAEHRIIFFTRYALVCVSYLLTITLIFPNIFKTVSSQWWTFLRLSPSS